MGQIYLVRHGQASFGAADYDRLSELGVEQSRLLGGWLTHCRQSFSQVVMGSLRRHRQTAEACLFAVPDGARPANGWETDPGFDEYDHVEMLVRHRPELADPQATERLFAGSDNPRREFHKVFTEAMARWMSGAHDADYREPWRVFRQRCLSALQRLVSGAGRSQSIIVFTSGGPIAAICQELLGMPDPQVAALNGSLVNSGVTRVLYQPGRVSLSYLNGFPHLEQTGRPDTITYR